MVWYGGGGLACAERGGAVGAAAGETARRHTDKASIVRKPYASHTSYNVAQ